MRERRTTLLLFGNVDQIPLAHMVPCGQDNAALRSQYWQMLQQAIQTSLTPRQREMIQLYYFEERTIPEIAQQLQVNKSTVCRTLQRARRRLQRAVQIWQPHI